MLISKILCIFAQTIKGMRQWLQILTGIILLMAGGMIYLLFRPTTLLGFRLTDAVGLSPFISGWRSSMETRQPVDFVVYCLPNGLWVAAYILIIDRVFASQPLRQRLSSGPQPFHSSASLPNCCKRSASCPAHSTGSTSCAILCHTLFI